MNNDFAFELTGSITFGGKTSTLNATPRERSLTGDVMAVNGAHSIILSAMLAAGAKAAKDLATDRPNPGAYDMVKAWRFVVDSHDGMNYSPTRREWTDAEILDFVTEHHFTGLDTFKL